MLRYTGEEEKAKIKQKTSKNTKRYNLKIKNKNINFKSNISVIKAITSGEHQKSYTYITSFSFS